MNRRYWLHTQRHVQEPRDLSEVLFIVNFFFSILGFWNTRCLVPNVQTRNLLVGKTYFTHCSQVLRFASIMVPGY